VTVTVIVLMKIRNAVVSKITKDLMTEDHHTKINQNLGRGKILEDIEEGAVLMNLLKNSIDQKSIKGKTQGDRLSFIIDLLILSKELNPSLERDKVAQEIKSILLSHIKVKNKLAQLKRNVGIKEGVRKEDQN